MRFKSVFLQNSVAKAIFPQIHWINRLWRDQFHSKKVLLRSRDLPNAVCFLCSAEDELIAPALHSGKLYQIVAEMRFPPEVLQIYMFEGVAHNNIQQNDDYYATLREFIEQNTECDPIEMAQQMFV